MRSATRRRSGEQQRPARVEHVDAPIRPQRAAPADVSAYDALFERALSRLDAETAHRLGTGVLRAAAAPPGAGRVLRRALGPTDPALRVCALGMELDSPLGLAAGFDKDARTLGGLWGLGFGFLEVGTLTARAQPGQPRPRIVRLPADRALVNRMGFPNDGAAAAAPRLRRRPPGLVVGVNVGRSRAATNVEAVADHRAAVAAVGALADYVVVNVSSPNTPGVRDLQALDALGELVAGVREELDARAPRRVPLLVKLSPDLDDAALDGLADLAVAVGLDGLIATNTTLSRAGLRSTSPTVAAADAGGLSGPPLGERALAVLARLHARTHGALTLVAAGGIADGEDAWSRIRAGATLVQAYTGFVYGGPLWVRRTHAELAARVRAAGLSSVADAVGADARF